VAEYGESTEPSPSDLVPKDARIEPIQERAKDGEVLSPERLIPTAPLTDTMHGLTSRPGAFSGPAGALLSAAMQTNQNFAMQSAADAKEARGALDEAKRVIADLREKLGRTEEKLANAINQKGVPTVLAGVGGVIGGKAWGLLGHPGVPNEVPYGLLVIAGFLMLWAGWIAAGRPIPAWLRKVVG
jgi:hypothetical protein